MWGREVKTAFSTAIISEPFYCSYHLCLIKFSTASNILDSLTSLIYPLPLEDVQIAGSLEYIKFHLFNGQTKFGAEVAEQTM